MFAFDKDMYADLVKSVSKSCPQGDDFSSYFINKMMLYASIREHLEKLNNKLQKVEMAFKDTKDAIDKSIESHQAVCDHPVTRYYGDPSGGNDSYCRCLICGDEC